MARVRTLAAAVTIGLVAAACGGSPPSAPPASADPASRPCPTPVAHLSEPVKADSIYLALLAAGLRIVPNNASTGGPGNEPVKRINATYAGWPLAISQFSSSASLRAATDWKAGVRPGQGESSIAFMGLNILVECGPTSGYHAKDARRSTAGGRRGAPSGARCARIADERADHRRHPGGARIDGRADRQPVAEGQTHRQTLREADRQGDQEAVTEPTRSARSRPASGRANDDVSPLDKRIIEHLQADGRRPYTQIAADLGVSEAAIRARTNRLIEHGILQVVGVTDPLKLGFHQMAMIGIRCESSKLIEVAERLAEMPEVDYVVITAGSYDLLIETVCEDNDALLAFLAERLRAIDGVRETETFVYLRLVKQTYQYGTR